MGWDNFVGGSITVTPPVPAERLVGSPFALFTDHTEERSEEARIVVITVDGCGYSEIVPACPDGIGSRSHDSSDAAAEIAKVLTELVDLIGAGHAYTDELTIEGEEGVGNAHRVRIVRRLAEGDQPERWEVVTEQAELIYPTDYAVPDGPAIIFDPAAARAWLSEEVADGVTRGASHYDILPGGMYEPLNDDSPADWLCRLLAAPGNLPACAWRQAPGIDVEIIETPGANRYVDGGAVLVVVVGGLRLASPWLTSSSLGTFDTDDAGIPCRSHLDVAIEALTAAAQTINTMVEQHRTARAAAAEVTLAVRDLGPLTAAIGVDIETALSTLGELVNAYGIDDPNDVLSERQRAVLAKVADAYDGLLAQDLTTDCDECRAAIPESHPSEVNDHHENSCSLHPSAAA